MKAINAMLKVILDGQAYLHASVVGLQDNLTDEQFEQVEADWKEETAKLIQELIDNEQA